MSKSRRDGRAQMKLTEDDVRQTALMARLELDEGELQRVTGELQAILGYMESLAAIDVEGVEPMTHAVELECVLRDDTPGPQLSADEALADAPRRHDGYFEVPKIIEGGE